MKFVISEPTYCAGAAVCSDFFKGELIIITSSRSKVSVSKQAIVNRNIPLGRKGVEFIIIAMWSILKEYVLATRPWSFTCGFIPVMVTAAVLGTSFLSIDFARAIVMAIAVQAGGNLTNTYYDFVNGVDTKAHGEKTIVDKKVSSAGVFMLSIFCYVLAFFAVLPVIISAADYQTMLGVFAAGVLLAFFYTAKPVGLKYCALGDITIFVCFGPLLMQGTSLILSGSTNDLLYIYSIPVGLMTEAVLMANNARDIKADTLAGAVTLASLLGTINSFYAYCFLFIGAFASNAFIAMFYNWGCIFTFITLPLVLGLCKDFKAGRMADLVEETAKVHLPYGVLMILGILFTNKGVF